MTRPLKFHQTLNQPTRNPRGKHRRPGKTAYRDPAIGAGDGTGGTIALGPFQVTWDQSRRYAQFTATSQGPGDGANVDQKAKIQAQAYADFWDCLLPTVPSVVTTGEIIGHRLWWLINGRLYSLAHEQMWEPGTVMEGDVDSQITDAMIDGGVYCCKDAEYNAGEGDKFGKMIDRMHPLWAAYTWCLSPRHQFIRNADAIVSGSVKLWGQVVEHETGYRAQYARIASLDQIHAPPYLAEPASRWLERLRREYGV